MDIDHLMSLNTCSSGYGVAMSVYSVVTLMVGRQVIRISAAQNAVHIGGNKTYFGLTIPHRDVP